MVRKSIKARAGFDIADLEPIDLAPKCTVPAIFIQGFLLPVFAVCADLLTTSACQLAGRNDTLVRPHHTQSLYEAYGSATKRRIAIEGGHNTGRGAMCLEEISLFLYTHFFTEEGMACHLYGFGWSLGLYCMITFTRAKCNTWCGWTVPSSPCQPR